jgi:excisionase family DNA binding protein
MGPLHDVKSAAKLLAVSPWTIRAYIRQAKLTPVRFGRLVRLEESEIQRFIASAKVQDSFAGVEIPNETGKDTQ